MKREKGKKNLPHTDWRRCNPNALTQNTVQNNPKLTTLFLLNGVLRAKPKLKLLLFVSKKPPKKSQERAINRKKTAAKTPKTGAAQWLLWSRHPPSQCVTSCRDRNTRRRHHLKAWADPAAVRRSAMTSVACWLVLPLLFLFWPALGNLLHFTYYL